MTIGLSNTQNRSVKRRIINLIRQLSIKRATLGPGIISFNPARGILNLLSRLHTNSYSIYSHDTGLVAEEVEATHYVDVLTGDVLSMCRAQESDDGSHIHRLAVFFHGDNILDSFEHTALLGALS